MKSFGRPGIVTAVLVALFLLGLTSCTAEPGSEDEAGGKSASQEPGAGRAEESGEWTAAESFRNGEDDLVIDLTVPEFIDRWNRICRESSEEDLALSLEGFETYATDFAIYSGHRTRHYIYSPGNERFYPVLDIYASEKGGELLQIELNYNEHDYREETWEIHEIMCRMVLEVLLPELEKETLVSLCRKVNELGAENIFPFDQQYGRDAVPSVLFRHGGIGVYPYFAEGSRSHFCVIPVDKTSLEWFESKGCREEVFPAEASVDRL